MLALVTELEITVLPLEWAFGLHSGLVFSSLLCRLPVLFPANHFKAQGFLLLNTMSNSLLDLSPAETSGQGATSVFTLSHLRGQSNYVAPKTQEPIDLTETSDMTAVCPDVSVHKVCTAMPEWLTGMEGPESMAFLTTLLLVTLAPSRSAQCILVCFSGWDNLFGIFTDGWHDGYRVPTNKFMGILALLSWTVVCVLFLFNVMTIVDFWNQCFSMWISNLASYSLISTPYPIKKRTSICVKLWVPSGKFLGMAVEGQWPLLWVCFVLLDTMKV